MKRYLKLAAALLLVFTTLAAHAVGTITTLGSSGTPTEFGQPITFTANVAAIGTGVSATGSVNFMDGTTSLGTVTLASGTASLNFSTLAAGTHTLAAFYTSDTPTNFSNSDSTGTPLTQGVNRAQALIAWTPTVSSIVFGTALGSSQLNATASSKYLSSVAGAFSYTPASGNMPGAGNPVTLSVSFTPADPNDFLAATGSANITVTQATPTITWSNPSPIPAGTPLSATQLNATATGVPGAGGPAPLPGNFVYNPASGAVLAAGNNQNLKVTFTPTDATDYITAIVNVSINVIANTATGITPNTGLLGDPNKLITITGTGFVANSVVQVNGTNLTTTFNSATSLSATVPASDFFTAQILNITVNNPAQGTTSNAVSLTVTAPPPVVTFTGPSSSTPTAQPTLGFTVVNPYPVAITATLTLNFTGIIIDPALQFATGGTTQIFTVPANSTTVPTIQLQTGTVAGTITVTLALSAGGSNVTPGSVQPLNIVIPPAVPVVTDVTFERDGNTITLFVRGFSNIRTMVQADFHFNAAPGTSFKDADITIPAATLFDAWYSDHTDSDQFGSAFTYTQPFTLDSDASAVASVTVTLTNSVGVSTVETAE
jgi:hypothetical protein